MKHKTYRPKSDSEPKLRLQPTQPLQQIKNDKDFFFLILSGENVS